MEIFVIIGVIVLLAVAYFCLGALLKFVLGWLPCIIFTLVAIAFFSAIGGYIAAFIAIVLFFVGIGVTDNWHSSEIYHNLESWVEKTFYLSD